MTTTQASEHPGNVRVTFRLDPDEDVWPPLSAETVWARVVEDGYAIENIPFFARGIAPEDVVSAVEEDGALVAQSVVRRCGHHLIRIVVFDQENFEAVAAQCVEFGCEWEGAGDHFANLLAVDIPPTAARQGLRQYLMKGHGKDLFDYEKRGSTGSWLSRTGGCATRSTLSRSPIVVFSPTPLHSLYAPEDDQRVDRHANQELEQERR